MGDNSRGQLGVGDPMKIPKCEMPNLLEKLPSPAVRAACGGAHSLVRMENGQCVSFGDDRNLQLGLRARSNLKALRDEARTIVATPQVVSCFAGKRIRQVAAGGGGVEGGHSVFLVDGEEGDELWACGYGRWGQLGGRAYTHVTEPARLTALGKLREWDERQQKVVSVRVEALACGARHSAALLSTGNVFTWGWNAHGQLGSGGKAGTHTPFMVKSPTTLRFAIMKGLACGPGSTAAWC